MFLKFDYGHVFKKYLLNISFFFGGKKRRKMKLNPNDVGPTHMKVKGSGRLHY